MKPFPKPVSREALLDELTKDKFVRNTNYGNNKIFVFSHHDSPNLMKEVGRLREIAFRSAGGGTGKEYDIDSYDIAENSFQQLIVWNEKSQEILGGYRFIDCNKAPRDENGKLKLATTGLFGFSEKFRTAYLPYVIELGRSWVQPKFQAKTARRQALFALDNLWDGLGALVVDYPHIKYFFGKVTMYLSYNRQARDILLFFLNRYFPDTENLVFPNQPLPVYTSKSKLEKLFTGKDFDENYRILNQEIRKTGENIPPLINSYMNLSPTMKTFGTALNAKFGNVEETGIMITIADVYSSKKNRHINSYMKK